MENLLQRNDSDKKFQNHHLSCLLRMFHVLVYHQKSSVKRIRKNNPLCCQAPKTISLEREQGGCAHQSSSMLMTDEAAADQNSKAIEIPGVAYIPSPIIILKSTKAEKDGEQLRRREASDSRDKMEVFQLIDPKSIPSSYSARKIVRSGSFPVEKPSTLENKMRETFPHIKPPSGWKTNPKILSASPKARLRKTSSVVSYIIHLKNKIKRALKHKDTIVECETSLMKASSQKEFLENCKQLLARSDNNSRGLNSDRSCRMILRSSSMKTFRRKPDLDYFVHYDVSESQASRETHPANQNTEPEPQSEEQSPISVLETRFPEESFAKPFENEDNMKSEACGMNELSESNDPEEKYIGEVLYVSGFSEGENWTKWHTTREPMDPQLYNDVEGIMYGEEGGDRREVFDAVNEALVEILGGARRYFPAKIRAPRGGRLVREVRKRVGVMRGCGVGELAVGNEWMDLIYDVEEVALDVEDVIFDDLLHEILVTLTILSVP